MELEYEVNKRHDVYWDDIPMFIHFDSFEIGIRAMNREDLLEIDSFEELASIDSRYSGIKEN